MVSVDAALSAQQIKMLARALAWREYERPPVEAWTCPSCQAHNIFRWCAHCGHDSGKQ